MSLKNLSLYFPYAIKYYCFLPVSKISPQFYHLPKNIRIFVLFLDIRSPEVIFSVRFPYVIKIFMFTFTHYYLKVDKHQTVFEKKFTQEYLLFFWIESREWICLAIISCIRIKIKVIITTKSKTQIFRQKNVSFPEPTHACSSFSPK